MMLFIYAAFILILLPCLFMRLRSSSASSQILEKKDTTSVRGISALFVIAAHYSIWIALLDGVSFIKPVSLGLGQLGGMGVLLFFFVSGYGINESYGDKKDLKGYILKRFLGVYLPYVLMKLITVTAEILCGVSAEDLAIPLRYLQILIIPDWFVLVIVLQYISYYVCSRFVKKHLIIGSIVIDALMSAVFILTDKPLGWFNALWLFTFGVLVSRYQPKMREFIEKRLIICSVVSFVGFAAFGALFAALKSGGWINVVKPVSGIFLCLFICCLLRRIDLSNRVIMWCGKRSLYLYIVHISVWDCLRIYIGNPALLIWISLAVTAGVTEGIYRGVSFVVGRIKNVSIGDTKRVE